MMFDIDILRFAEWIQKNIPLIKKIINLAKTKTSKFVFITTWDSFSDDIICKLNHTENKNY